MPAPILEHCGAVNQTLALTMNLSFVAADVRRRTLMIRSALRFLTSAATMEWFMGSLGIFPSIDSADLEPPT